MFPAFFGLIVLGLLVFAVGMLSGTEDRAKTIRPSGEKSATFPQVSADTNTLLTIENAMRQAEIGKAEKPSAQSVGFYTQTKGQSKQVEGNQGRL
jgi:hypothetical protein